MRIPRLAALAVLASLVLAAPASPPARAQGGMGRAEGPSGISVRAGTIHGDTATLAVRDRFGPGDAVGGFVRLDPQGRRFAARFSFSSAGEAADLLLGLRAPASGTGSWVAEVLDGGAWVTLWRSKGGVTGAWWGGSLPLPDDAGAGLVIRVTGRGEPLYLDRLARATSPWRPAPGTTWQWQLSGAIDTSLDVAMYDIDLVEAPDTILDTLQSDGRVVVCYFSAGAWESFRPDAGLFPGEVLGEENGWPGERWLDVRRLDVLAPIMEARLDLAAARGCDGVEPDNVDGYANDTGFPLTAADQRRYNIWLAERAHERGLSVGLKNDLGQVPRLAYLFDWALNEQCFQYHECPALFPFVAAGKAVFGVEYQGEPASFCPQANSYGFSWLSKRLGLGAWVIACLP